MVFSPPGAFPTTHDGFFSRNVWAAFSGWLHWLRNAFRPINWARLCHKGARATFHKDDVNEANLDLGEPGGLLKLRTCLTPGKEEFTCWFTMVYLLSFALLIGKYFVTSFWHPCFRQNINTRMFQPVPLSDGSFDKFDLWFSNSFLFNKVLLHHLTFTMPYVLMWTTGFSGHLGPTVGQPTANCLVVALPGRHEFLGRWDVIVFFLSHGFPTFRKRRLDQEDHVDVVMLCNLTWASNS